MMVNPSEEEPTATRLPLALADSTIIFDSPLNASSSWGRNANPYPN